MLHDTSGMFIQMKVLDIAIQILRWTILQSEKINNELDFHSLRYKWKSDSFCTNKSNSYREQFSADCSASGQKQTNIQVTTAISNVRPSKHGVFAQDCTRLHEPAQSLHGPDGRDVGKLNTCNLVDT